MEYEERILAALEKWPGSSARVICNRLKADKDRLAGAMADMERRGLIMPGMSQRKRAGRHLWVWRITNKGAQVLGKPHGKFDM